MCYVPPAFSQHFSTKPSFLCSKDKYKLALSGSTVHFLSAGHTCTFTLYFLPHGELRHFLLRTPIGTTSFYKRSHSLPAKIARSAWIIYANRPLRLLGLAVHTFTQETGYLAAAKTRDIF